MKSLILAFALSLSTSAFARQYIQCSSTDYSSTDVAVVNLTTVKGGTLFISSGMQNPEDERTVVKIAFDKVEGANHVYKLVDAPVEGYVTVPTAAIGKYSNYLAVDLQFGPYFVQYSCFSAIYND
jgi:hypothetical protein